MTLAEQRKGFENKKKQAPVIVWGLQLNACGSFFLSVACRALSSLSMLWHFGMEGSSSPTALPKQRVRTVAATKTHNSGADSPGERRSGQALAAREDSKPCTTGGRFLVALADTLMNMVLLKTVLVEPVFPWLFFPPAMMQTLFALVFAANGIGQTVLVATDAKKAKEAAGRVFDLLKGVRASGKATPGHAHSLATALMWDGQVSEMAP